MLPDPASLLPATCYSVVLLFAAVVTASSILVSFLSCYLFFPPLMLFVTRIYYSVVLLFPAVISGVCFIFFLLLWLSAIYSVFSLPLAHTVY